MWLAVQASRLHIDWRPVVGLTPADAGTAVEVVLARFITVTALELHNRDVEAEQAEISRINN